MEKQEFITTVAALVAKYARGYGILVHSPIIAQGVIESNWGNSTLSTKYHNYFGLKCGSKWTGKSVNMRTNEEYTPGTLTQINDNFRVYESMEEGVKDYFEFIRITRYQNLKGITDPRKYLGTIKADGYATSSKYVENNMRIVEQYNLSRYDKGEETMAKLASSAIGQARAWVGRNEASGSHREIIDTYNAHKPLARGYAVKHTDAWCATFISAVAIKCGLTSIIPTECGCGQMIALLKALGEWIENENRTPNAGDIIFYDWDDNGTGDNTGWPDHVGIVEKVRDNTITVIEGNISNSVGRRTLAVNGRYIRGYGVPKYDEEQADQETTKSVETVAKEVIAGKWGNGTDRKNSLEAAGYNYNAVQAAVNQIASGTAVTPTKSIAEVAREVINGLWGNGTDRKGKLEAAGYNYAEVQRKVNALLK